MFKSFFYSKKRIIISLLLLLTLLASAFATYFVFKNDSRFSTGDNQILGESTNNSEFIPVDPPEDLNTLNILLLGYGGAGHQGGFLTDAIQVAHFDFAKGTLKFISIPRDLWVGLPNNKSAKINTAFTLGDDPQDKIGSGAEIAKQMAQTITGLKIDHYIAIDFNGYKRAIGYSLNGIEVDVPDTLHDGWYPIEGKQQEPCGLTPEEIADVTNKYSGFELEKQFPCRYEEIYFPQGKNTMEGHDALAYVRSRHGSTGGDFDRSKRQVAVLEGIKKKLFSLEIFDKLPAFYKDITKHTSSDIDWEIAKYLSPAFKGSKEYKVDSIVLSTENVFTNSRSNSGQFILVPKAGLNNWAAVHQHVADNL
jgi:anionic cell wall polymer biosynthesis LytR-Cps2A-Psr (LCP) family protein